MRTSVREWIEAARRGEPVWLADMRGEAAAMPGAASVTARLLRLDGNILDFPFSIPRWETGEERSIVEEYLRAIVFNILSVHSGRRLEFLLNREDEPVRALLRALTEAFQVEKTRRVGYGKVISIAGRLCRAFDCGAFALDTETAVLAPPVAAPARGSYLADRFLRAADRAKKGLYCGLDIGGTDVKLVLAEDGRLADVRVLDWDPSSCPTAEGIMEPILALVRTALDGCVPGKRLDGIGVSFPDVVIRGRIVGGETPKTRGMREHAADYEAEFSKLSGLRDRLGALCVPGAPIRLVNDGHMAAFTAAAELAWGGRGGELAGGVVAHSLGTDLGTGWLEPDGTVPEAPMELYDLLLDLGSWPERAYPPRDLRSVRNENSGLPGMRRYVGQSAAFRLAWEQAPSLLDGSTVREEGILRIREQPDMRKPCLARLMAAAGRGDRAAGEIFRQIGRNLGQVFREMEWLMRPGTDTRFLFGRFIMEPVCLEYIREGCAETAPWVRLAAADENAACSPLMAQLASWPGVTVAQFGQAVGAVYFSLY